MDYRTKSWWLESLPGKIIPNPTLDSSELADVAIIGGYTALSAAYHLKKIGITLSIFLFLFGCYSFWSQAGRTVDEPGSGLFLQEIAEFGAAGGLGNVIGIQPYMLPMDYASEERFCRKIIGYFEVVEKRGWLNEKTIIVLPEYLGTWLVAAGEKRAVYQAANIEAAMQTMVLSNLFSFLKTLPFARGNDVVKDSVFRMKAATMAQTYHNVFSRLAQQYAVTIVAGSIVLPAPRIREGQLTVGDGELYNVSVVYRPDGTPYPRIVKKVFPINDELPFTARSAADSLPVFETLAGKLGVLICADSWYPSTYETLKTQRTDILAVPSYLAPDSIWATPWRGYNGAPAPEDVDEDDIDTLSEGEAWLKYALAGRSRRVGIKHGMNVFLRGKLWDLGSDGHSIMVNNQKVLEAKHVAGASIVNLWL